MANRIAMVASVSAMAISGDVIAISAERSARRSSTNGMARPLLRRASLARAAAHEQAELLARRRCRIERRRQCAVEHHGDAIGDLGELVEILADHQHGAAAGGEID